MTLIGRFVASGSRPCGSHGGPMMVARRLALIAAALVGAAAAAAQPPAAGTVHLVPTEIIDADGRSWDAEEGLLFVPENRAKRDSRTISIHFLRVRAGQGGGIPLVYLPGGPGTAVTRASFRDPRRRELSLMLKAGRDVLYVNQRGNPHTPGAAPMMLAQQPPSGEATPADAAEKLRIGLRASLARWSARDVDLSAYTILEASDDVADLGRALGHDRIILAGGSFGSQWSLAILRRHPQLVDRALLFGVEPLDHAYDSPVDVWRVYERLDREARRDPELAQRLAGRRLTDIARDLVEALRSSPREVFSAGADGTPARRLVTADDLREALIRPLPQASLRENLEAWPKFVLELDAGDFRHLATLAADAHGPAKPEPLIFHLIDHSIGTSAGRDLRLKREAERVPLGDLNAAYRAVQGLVPTRPIYDSLRTGRIQPPVLIVHGDMDLSTPIENMADLVPDLADGRTLRVEGGGTHSVLGDLIAGLPEVAEGVMRFVACPVPSRTACPGVAEGRVRLPPLSFRSPGAPALAGDRAAP